MQEVDEEQYEKGIASYLATRPPDQDGQQRVSHIDRNDAEFYEQKFGWLLQVALGKGANPTLILPVLGGFKSQADKSRVQMTLVHKSLDNDLIDDAVKYAEHIDLPHWRPGVLGDVARHQHLCGRPSQALLTNALQHARISEEGHQNSICSMFPSPFVADFGGLIGFGRNICKR